MHFKDLSINELINKEFHCSCGRDHAAMIENIAVGEGALQNLPDILAGQKLNDESLLTTEDKIFVVADVNTWQVGGEKVMTMVAELGYPVERFVYPYASMHAEEQYADEMKAALPADTKLIIAVGSGTLNDLTRYVAHQVDVPYYIVATAPSMDGYASNVSPLVVNNLKITFPAVTAAAIIGDTEMLATAPDVMIAAGLGDVLGKYLAINDWRMSEIINGEYYCPEVGDLVLSSVQKCVATVPGLVKREPQALTYLMESLVLIGIAMSYIGYSRPASSSEHHMSHLLEMKAIFKHEYGQLHGTCVGMATCMIGEMYRHFLTTPVDFDKAKAHAAAFDYAAWEGEIKRVYGAGADEVLKLYAQVHQNDAENVEKRLAVIAENRQSLWGMMEAAGEQTKSAPELLASLGGLTTPEGFGLSKEEFRDTIVYCKELRNRYGALQFFYDMGVLEELADYIVDKYM